MLAQLAQSEAQLGDYANAERHFVEAWEIQPNSVSIARGYATLLVQIGKKQAAAEVLQSASRFAPNNIALREAWLNLALEGADLSGLLQIRLSRYSSNPDDLRNVIELALLLGVAEPTVQTIRILDPKFSYDENQFNQLPAERQDALIESNRQAWWKQSDELLDEVLQAADPQFDALAVAAYKAEISKRQGRSELGIAALRDLVSSSEDDELSLKANLLLSNLFSELGRTDESIAILEPLNEISATFAAASIYMSKNQFAEAADQYEMLVAKLPEASDASTVRVFRPDGSRPGLVESVLPRHAFFEQYSECLARSGRPAEAQAIFDGLPSPQDDRDKAARALIQSMIYAGYASKKYSEMKMEARMKLRHCRRSCRPSSCCHVILVLAFLKRQSTPNDSAVRVIKRPTKLLSNLSLKRRDFLPSQPPWPQPALPFWTQGGYLGRYSSPPDPT